MVKSSKASTNLIVKSDCPVVNSHSPHLEGQQVVVSTNRSSKAVTTLTSKSAKAVTTLTFPHKGMPLHLQSFVIGSSGRERGNNRSKSIIVFMN